MALLRIKDYLLVILSIVSLCSFLYIKSLKNSLKSYKTSLIAKDMQIVSLKNSIDKQNEQIKALKLDIKNYQKPSQKQEKIKQVKENDELKAYKELFRILGE